VLAEVIGDIRAGRRPPGEAQRKTERHYHTACPMRRLRAVQGGRLEARRLRGLRGAAGRLPDSAAGPLSGPAVRRQLSPGETPRAAGIVFASASPISLVLLLSVALTAALNFLSSTR
jgi:hypothetical protein